MQALVEMERDGKITFLELIDAKIKSLAALGINEGSAEFKEQMNLYPYNYDIRMAEKKLAFRKEEEAKPDTHKGFWLDELHKTNPEAWRKIADWQRKLAIEMNSLKNGRYPAEQDQKIRELEAEVTEPELTPLESFHHVFREFIGLCTVNTNHLNAREMAVAKTQMETALLWAEHAMAKHHNRPVANNSTTTTTTTTTTATDNGAI